MTRNFLNMFRGRQNSFRSSGINPPDESEFEGCVCSVMERSLDGIKEYLDEKNVYCGSRSSDFKNPLRMFYALVAEKGPGGVKYLITGIDIDYLQSGQEGGNPFEKWKRRRLNAHRRKRSQGNVLNKMKHVLRAHIWLFGDENRREELEILREIVQLMTGKQYGSKEKEAVERGEALAKLVSTESMTERDILAKIASDFYRKDIELRSLCRPDLAQSSQEAWDALKRIFEGGEVTISGPFSVKNVYETLYLDDYVQDTGTSPFENFEKVWMRKAHSLKSLTDQIVAHVRASYGDTMSFIENPTERLKQIVRNLRSRTFDSFIWGMIENSDDIIHNCVGSGVYEVGIPIERRFCFEIPEKEKIVEHFEGYSVLPPDEKCVRIRFEEDNEFSGDSAWRGGDMFVTRTELGDRISFLFFSANDTKFKYNHLEKKLESTNKSLRFLMTEPRISYKESSKGQGQSIRFLCLGTYVKVDGSDKHITDIIDSYESQLRIFQDDPRVLAFGWKQKLEMSGKGRRVSSPRRRRRGQIVTVLDSVVCDFSTKLMRELLFDKSVESVRQIWQKRLGFGSLDRNVSRDIPEVKYVLSLLSGQEEGKNVYLTDGEKVENILKFFRNKKINADVVSRPNIIALSVARSNLHAMRNKLLEFRDSVCTCIVFLKFSDRLSSRDLTRLLHKTEGGSLSILMPYSEELVADLEITSIWQRVYVAERGSENRPREYSKLPSTFLINTEEKEIFEFCEEEYARLSGENKDAYSKFKDLGKWVREPRQCNSSFRFVVHYDSEVRKILANRLRHLLSSKNDSVSLSIADCSSPEYDREIDAILPTIDEPKALRSTARRCICVLDAELISLEEKDSLIKRADQSSIPLVFIASELETDDFALVSNELDFDELVINLNHVPLSILDEENSSNDNSSMCSALHFIFGPSLSLRTLRNLSTPKTSKDIRDNAVVTLTQQGTSSSKQEKLIHIILKTLSGIAIEEEENEELILELSVAFTKLNISKDDHPVSFYQFCRDCDVAESITQEQRLIMWLRCLKREHNFPLDHFSAGIPNIHTSRLLNCFDSGSNIEELDPNSRYYISPFTLRGSFSLAEKGVLLVRAVSRGLELDWNDSEELLRQFPFSFSVLRDMILFSSCPLRILSYISPKVIDSLFRTASLRGIEAIYMRLRSLFNQIRSGKFQELNGCAFLSVIRWFAQLRLPQCTNLLQEVDIHNMMRSDIRFDVESKEEVVPVLKVLFSLDGPPHVIAQEVLIKEILLKYDGAEVTKVLKECSCVGAAVVDFAFDPTVYAQDDSSLFSTGVFKLLREYSQGRTDINRETLETFGLLKVTPAFVRKLLFLGSEIKHADFIQNFVSALFPTLDENALQFVVSVLEGESGRSFTAVEFSVLTKFFFSFRKKLPEIEYREIHPQLRAIGRLLSDIDDNLMDDFANDINFFISVEASDELANRYLQYFSDNKLKSLEDREKLYSRLRKNSHWISPYGAQKLSEIIDRQPLSSEFSFRYMTFVLWIIHPTRNLRVFPNDIREFWILYRLSQDPAFQFKKRVEDSVSYVSELALYFAQPQYLPQAIVDYYDTQLQEFVDSKGVNESVDFVAAQNTKKRQLCVTVTPRCLPQEEIEDLVEKATRRLRDLFESGSRDHESVFFEEGEKRKLTDSFRKILSNGVFFTEGVSKDSIYGNLEKLCTLSMARQHSNERGLCAVREGNVTALQDLLLLWFELIEYDIHKIGRVVSSVTGSEFRRWDGDKRLGCWFPVPQTMEVYMKVQRSVFQYFGQTEAEKMYTIQRLNSFLDATDAAQLEGNDPHEIASKLFGNRVFANLNESKPNSLSSCKRSCNAFVSVLMEVANTFTTKAVEMIHSAFESFRECCVQPPRKKNLEATFFRCIVRAIGFGGRPLLAETQGKLLQKILQYCSEPEGSFAMCNATFLEVKYSAEQSYISICDSTGNRISEVAGAGSAFSSYDSESFFATPHADESSGKEIPRGTRILKTPKKHEMRFSKYSFSDEDIVRRVDEDVRNINPRTNTSLVEGCGTILNQGSGTVQRLSAFVGSPTLSLPEKSVVIRAYDLLEMVPVKGGDKKVMYFRIGVRGGNGGALLVRTKDWDSGCKIDSWTTCSFMSREEYMKLEDDDNFCSLLSFPSHKEAWSTLNRTSKPGTIFIGRGFMLKKLDNNKFKPMIFCLQEEEYSNFTALDIPYYNEYLNFGLHPSLLVLFEQLCIIFYAISVDNVGDDDNLDVSMYNRNFLVRGHNSDLSKKKTAFLENFRQLWDEYFFDEEGSDSEMMKFRDAFCEKLHVSETICQHFELETLMDAMKKAQMLSSEVATLCEKVEFLLEEYLWPFGNSTIEQRYFDKTLEDLREELSVSSASLDEDSSEGFVTEIPRRLNHRLPYVMDSLLGADELCGFIFPHQFMTRDLSNTSVNSSAGSSSLNESGEEVSQSDSHIESEVEINYSVLNNETNLQWLAQCLRCPLSTDVRNWLLNIVLRRTVTDVPVNSKRERISDHIVVMCLARLCPIEDIKKLLEYAVVLPKEVGQYFKRVSEYGVYVCNSGTAEELEKFFIPLREIDWRTLQIQGIRSVDQVYSKIIECFHDDICIVYVRGMSEVKDILLKWLAEYTKRNPWRFVYLEQTETVHNLTEVRDRCNTSLFLKPKLEEAEGSKKIEHVNYNASQGNNPRDGHTNKWIEENSGANTKVFSELIRVVGDHWCAVGRKTQNAGEWEEDLRNWIKGEEGSQNRNTVVYGLFSPPGAGKTYFTDNKLKALCENEEVVTIDCSSDVLVYQSLWTLLEERCSGRSRTMLVADEYHLLDENQKRQLFEFASETSKSRQFRVLLIGNRREKVDDDCVNENSSMDCSLSSARLKVSKIMNVMHDELEECAEDQKRYFKWWLSAIRTLFSDEVLSLRKTEDMLKHMISKNELPHRHVALILLQKVPHVGEFFCLEFFKNFHDIYWKDKDKDFRSFACEDEIHPIRLLVRASLLNQVKNETNNVADDDEAVWPSFPEYSSELGHSSELHPLVRMSAWVAFMYEVSGYVRETGKTVNLRGLLNLRVCDRPIFPTILGFSSSPVDTRRGIAYSEEGDFSDLTWIRNALRSHYAISWKKVKEVWGKHFISDSDAFLSLLCECSDPYTCAVSIEERNLYFLIINHRSDDLALKVFSIFFEDSPHCRAFNQPYSSLYCAAWLLYCSKNQVSSNLVRDKWADNELTKNKWVQLFLWASLFAWDCSQDKHSDLKECLCSITRGLVTEGSKDSKKKCVQLWSGRFSRFFPEVLEEERVSKEVVFWLSKSQFPPDPNWPPLLRNMSYVLAGKGTAAILADLSQEEQFFSEPGKKSNVLCLPFSHEIRREFFLSLFKLKIEKLPLEWQRSLLLDENGDITSSSLPAFQNGGSGGTDDERLNIIRRFYEEGLQELSEAKMIWNGNHTNTLLFHRLKESFVQVHGGESAAIAERKRQEKEEKILEKRAQEKIRDNMTYLKSVCGQPAILEYYNLYVGEKGYEAMKSTSCQRDEYKNPVGPDFDLGKEGAFGGFRVLIGQFYHQKLEDGNEELPRSELEHNLRDMRSKGFQYVIVEREVDFIGQLNRSNEPFHAAWIISSSAIEMRDRYGGDDAEKYEKFAYEILKFHLSGKGLFIFSENAPFFAHSNIVLERIFGVKDVIEGNLEGNRFIVRDRRGHSNLDLSPGEFCRQYHLVCTGLETLYEGTTISYPSKRIPGMKAIVRGGHVEKRKCEDIILAYENSGRRGRIVVDTGHTKLWKQWRQGGTDRYVNNVTIWLFGVDIALKSSSRSNALSIIDGQMHPTETGTFDRFRIRKAPDIFLPPLDVLLVVDTSGSMHGDVPQAKQFSENMVDFFRIGRDDKMRMGLVDFNTYATLVVPLTDDRRMLHRGIQSLTSTGITYYAKALNECIKEFANNGRRGVKRLVIFETDGFPCDDISTISQAQRELINVVRATTIAICVNTHPRALNILKSCVAGDPKGGSSDGLTIMIDNYNQLLLRIHEVMQTVIRAVGHNV